MGEFWQAPRPVEAVHFTGDTDVLNRFVGTDGWTRADAVDMPYMDDGEEVVVWSEMFQAHLPCRVGWWVVRIADGSFLPVSPGAFEATYDRNVCRCGHREQAHRLGPCGFIEIDPDDAPVKCRCAAFDRATWTAGVAAGPQATPDQVLWEGETRSGHDLHRVDIAAGESDVPFDRLLCPPGTRVRVVAVPTDPEDQT